MPGPFDNLSQDDPFGEDPAENVNDKVNARADELGREKLYTDQAEAQRAAWDEHGNRKRR